MMVCRAMRVCLACLDCPDLKVKLAYLAYQA